MVKNLGKKLVFVIIMILSINATVFASIDNTSLSDLGTTIEIVTQE